MAPPGRRPNDGARQQTTWLPLAPAGPLNASLTCWTPNDRSVVASIAKILKARGCSAARECHVTMPAGPAGEYICKYIGTCVSTPGYTYPNKLASYTHGTSLYVHTYVRTRVGSTGRNVVDGRSWYVESHTPHAWRAVAGHGQGSTGAVTTYASVDD